MKLRHQRTWTVLLLAGMWVSVFVLSTSDAISQDMDGLPFGSGQAPFEGGMAAGPMAASPGPAPALAVPGPAPVHEDVVRVVRGIEEALRAVNAGLERRRIDPLAIDFRVVMGECEKLVGLAVQRADPSTLRAQFALYRLAWRRMATRLKAMPQADPELVGLADAVDRSNDLLQEVLVLGPGGVYDRKKVAELCDQLVDASGMLFRVIKVQALSLPVGGPDLIRAAGRVKAQADGLAQAVQQNAAFTVVVEQHDRFAAAWKELASVLPNPPPTDPLGRPLVPEISQADAALGEALLVEPPGVSIYERRMKLATNIAQQGDALVACLLEQLLNNAGPVHAAEDFAISAEGLRLWLKAHPMSQVEITRPEVVAVRESWRRVETQMARLERAKFPKAFELSEQIKTEWEILFKVLE